MGGCCAQTTLKNKNPKSKSADIVTNQKVQKAGSNKKTFLVHLEGDTMGAGGPGLQSLNPSHTSNQSGSDMVQSGSHSIIGKKTLQAFKSKNSKDEKDSDQLKSSSNNMKQSPQIRGSNDRGNDENELHKFAVKVQKKVLTYDISPNINRYFKIYFISNQNVVASPYSKDTEWQQILQLHAQKLNLSSIQTTAGISSLKSKKHQDVETHLSQIQMHREIELMVKILNMRNRNWMQEQIKMQKRLANMQPGSFDSLVVTREYLQFKEHFNWLLWAVGFYYYQMQKIDLFFQYFQQKQIKLASEKGLIEHSGSTSQAAQTDQSKQSRQNLQVNQRTKQAQIQFDQELNLLMNQIKSLKTKLPSPISKKWTEGFSFMGVYFRMIPMSDSFHIKNEMKALKYMQNELMQLSQIQNQLRDLATFGGSHQHQQKQSIYKNIILPLLSGVEQGGFLIYATPIIYVQDYHDESHLQNQKQKDQNQLQKGQDQFRKNKNDDENVELSPQNHQKNMNSLLYSRNYQNHSASFKKKNSYTHLNEQNKFYQQQARIQRKKKTLTSAYGQRVFQNYQILVAKIYSNNNNPRNSQAKLPSHFPDPNNEEFEDELLMMMPLLKNVTHQNLIPLYDFEEFKPSQTIEVNYLLTHVYDCLPEVDLKQTVLFRIPVDQSQEICFFDWITNYENVTVDEIKRILRFQAKKIRFNDQQTPIQHPEQFVFAGQNKQSQYVLKNDGGHQNDFSGESSVNFDDELEHPVYGQVEEDPSQIFEIKSITKNGFDILMISKNVKKYLQSMKQKSTNSETKFNQQQRRNSSTLINKRAQSFYNAKEDESNLAGQVKMNSSQLIRRIQEKQFGLNNQMNEQNNENLVNDGIGPIRGSTIVNQPKINEQNQGKLQGLKYNYSQNKKQSILRKVNTNVGLGLGGYKNYDSHLNMGGLASVFDDANDNILNNEETQLFYGNTLVIAHNSASQFKLKYQLINHTYAASIEQIFMASLDKISQQMETTDTIQNIYSLKELMHRKGLNLRFQWLLLTKLKSQFNRQLVMIHILVRIIKKIINEESKLKAQVITPNKPKALLAIPPPKSLVDVQNKSEETANGIDQTQQVQCDHFIGNQSEGFKDNLVYISNTLLRRKFSKQKHIFDEILIAIFLNRLKVIPIISSFINFGTSSKKSLMKEQEINYVQSKDILDEIIASPSQNPALYMNAIQSYFNIDIELEFMRKCRQDKYLFLSQLNSQPMVLSNITNINLTTHNYFSLKEYSYFMLANQIYKGKSQFMKDTNKYPQLNQTNAGATANQNLRSNIFRHQIPQKNERTTIYNENEPKKSEYNQSEALNSSSVTDKHKFKNQIDNPQQSLVISRASALQSQNNALNGLQLQKETPRQFNNIDEVDLRDYDSPSKGNMQRLQPQILGMSLNKLGDNKILKDQGEIIIPSILYKLNCKTSSNPQINQTSNLLPYYLMPNQDILNTWIMYLESILKDVYSVEGSEQILLEAFNSLAINIYFSTEIESISEQQFNKKIKQPIMTYGNGFDKDQFTKICSKIKDIQSFMQKCSPEVIAVSQMICGLSFELFDDSSIFPIESEKCYLTSLICLFQLIGDPRGRGNVSLPFLLLITWKLSLLSLSIENRKVHDAEFSEELFDAALCNLSNHQMLFRSHQNEKLNRVILQQKENHNKQGGSVHNELSQDIQAKKKMNQNSTGQLNSRRSIKNANAKDQMYQISSFEQEMDYENRNKNKFDIRKYKTGKKINAIGAENMHENNLQFKEDSNTPKQNLNQINAVSSLSNVQNISNLNVIYGGGFQNVSNSAIVNVNIGSLYQGHQQQNYKNQYQNAERINKIQHLSGRNGNPKETLNYANSQNYGNIQIQKELSSLLEANISDIELEIAADRDEIDVEENDDTINKSYIGAGNMNYSVKEYLSNNFCQSSVGIPEVPFVHWSIYRQSIQNLLIQQGHKFQKNQKQLNKFLCQMHRNVLNTALDKSLFYQWLVRYNLQNYQSGIQWKNNQIKQAVYFQSAQMISSRSSSKSFQKDQSEYSLSLSVQNSLISQGGIGSGSFRSGPKTQNLGSYSSIINTENGSINKGDINGIIYSWGSDAQGQLGLDGYAHLTQKQISQKVLYPRMLSALKDEFIKDICCGYAHTLAITNNGQVYSWGNNENCQLGLGDKAPDCVTKPKLIQNLKYIVKLAAGNEHSVAINKNQELFSWGSMYQTGQNDTKNRCDPQKIDYFRNYKIQQVACGGLHTLAVTKENKVFCWGSTEGGQLGLPQQIIQKLCKNEENAIKFPQQIVSLQDYQVIQVACGETHSICLCKDGSIFGWGLSLYGQLGLGFSSDSFEPGLGMEKSKVPEPRRIETLKDEQIQKIFCGSTFSLFLSKTGEIYGCGMNDLGQLGEDIFNDLSALENARMGQIQTSDITIPTQISSLQGIQINTVACGEAHVLAIDGDGKDSRNMLWAWGQYKNGQLGLGEVNMKLNPRPIQSLSSGKIQRIAAGSSHSLALIGDASNVTTLSPNYYASNEFLSNSWQMTGPA